MSYAPHFTGGSSLDDDERYLNEVMSDAGLSTPKPAYINPQLAEMQLEVKREKLIYLERDLEDAVARDDFTAATSLKAEIESIQKEIVVATRAVSPLASSPFQVGDIVRIVVENEPGAHDPDRSGTAKRMGQIIQDDELGQAFLVQFADGRESWYKASWLTSQKAMKAAAEEVRRREEEEAAAEAAKNSFASSSSALRESGPGCTGASVSGAPSSRTVTCEQTEPAPEVSQECIQLIIDGSQKEERAMIFDRAGAYPGAINLYREGASMLAEALNLLPMNHPDTPVMETHIQEVHTRANYLHALGVQPAEIPLEEMIHGQQLQMGMCARGSDTTIAAGAVLGVAGLAISGPLMGLALAAGAAYATTRQDAVGKAARAVGDVGVQAADHTRSLNNKYRFDKKIDDKLHISDTASKIDDKLHISHLAQQAGATARAANERFSITERTQAAADQTSSFVKSVDEKLHISSTTKAAVGRTGQALSDFNEKHQITDKVSLSVKEVSSSMSSWVSKKISSSLSSSFSGT